MVVGEAQILCIHTYGDRLEVNLQSISFYSLRILQAVLLRTAVETHKSMDAGRLVEDTVPVTVPVDVYCEVENDIRAR